MKYNKGGRIPENLEDSPSKVAEDLPNNDETKEKSNISLILSYLKSHSSEPAASESTKNIFANTSFNTYYDFYRAVNADKKKSKSKKKSKVAKVISYSQFKENLIMDDLYVRNKLDTFFRDNVDIIEKINNNINIKNLRKNTLSPIIEDSFKRLSPIKEGGSRRLIKGGNNKLTSLGNSFLSVLHILDRKHDFNSDSSVDIKEYIYDNGNVIINGLLGTNQYYKTQILDMYNDSSMEKKILLNTIDKIIDGSYIEDTQSFANFSFIDRGIDDSLDVYKLKTKKSSINFAANMDENDKIAQIIKEFFNYNDNTNKYIKDINLTSIFSQDIDDDFYAKLGEKLRPFENAYDPHASEKIEIPPNMEDIYKHITDLNFNKLSVSVPQYYSAIRDITREYLGFEYYKDPDPTVNKYYLAIYFKDNSLISNFKIFDEIRAIPPAPGVTIYHEDIIPELLCLYSDTSITKYGIYYKKSFNSVSNIKKAIDALMTIKKTANIHAEMTTKYDISITLADYKRKYNKNPGEAIIHLIITYLYHTQNMKIIVQPMGNINDIRKNIITNIIDILFDLKKSGDWSQALFCSNYNKLPNTDKDCFFISGDFLASVRSMMSTNVKNLFSADYKTIDPTSDDKKSNMIGLFKNMEKITFKDLTTLVRDNIFSEDMFKPYAVFITPELFFLNTRQLGEKEFNENDIIKQEEFNSINFNKILLTLCYIFMLYLADNALINLSQQLDPTQTPIPNKYNLNILPYPRLKLPQDMYDIDDLLTPSDFYNRYNLFTNSDYGNRKELKGLFDLYIKDFKSKYMPNFDSVDTNHKYSDVYKIIINISNVNKLYDIVVCNKNNDDMSRKGITKIKEIFNTNAENILEFINKFNNIYNKDTILKKDIGSHFIHKSLYEEYIIHRDYVNIRDTLIAIYNDIDPLERDNFIIKFRFKFNIDKDIVNKTKIVNDLKAYFTANSALLQTQQNRLLKIRRSLNKQLSNLNIDSNMYDLYVDTVLPLNNKALIKTPGIKQLYDNYLKDHDHKLKSIITNSKSYTIAELLLVIEKAITETFGKYEQLYKILENVYSADDTSSRYMLTARDIERLPITSPNINRENKIFRAIPTIPIPAPIPVPSLLPAAPATVVTGQASTSRNGKRRLEPPVIPPERQSRRVQLANTREQDEIVIDKNKFLLFYNKIKSHGGIINIGPEYDLFKMVPSFLKDIRIYEESEYKKKSPNTRMNKMLRTICLLTYMSDELLTMQSPLKLFNDLSRALDGNYELIKIINLTRTNVKSDKEDNYFFGPNTKLVRLIKLYVSHMIEDELTNYITKAKIVNNYGLDAIFNTTTNYETLNILSNKLDILVKFAGGIKTPKESTKKAKN
jgi:hypothetical protein